MSKTDAASEPGLPYSFAREAGILLLGLDDKAHIATRGAASPFALIETRRVLGRPVRIEMLEPSAFERLLSDHYAVRSVDAADFDTGFAREDDLSRLADGVLATEDLLASDDDAPVIRLINGLIAEAARRNASDIHIEPGERNLAVRMRVDGLLHDTLSLAPRLAAPIVSRIKVMARLDITERRLPQDGRMSLAIGGKALDVRVSTLPGRHGERAVLRILDHEREHLTIAALGMPASTRRVFEAALVEPNGIILVSGPTGSGKTTTLYAGLGALNDRSRNILTIEDPVEYALDGVGQTQVNTKVGMTFAAGLRAILRQDPDIVMVGEIRDAETAQIAVQASLTGHLVLSTIHTNSAVATTTRLRDMGVESFMLASSLKAVIAQRLVRRLCQHCRAPRETAESERALFAGHDIALERLWRAEGCEACGRTGFEGRIGLYEILRVDSAIRRLIHGSADEAAIAGHAFRDHETLLGCGLARAAAGETTLEEVLRVCRQEDSDGEL